MSSSQVFFHSKSLNPNVNFSLEQYFLYNTAENIVLFYRNKPSLILGNFQCAYKEVSLPSSVSIFRRISGGGCVYHDEGNLNIAIFSDKEQSLDNLRWIQKILKSLEKDVEISSRKDLLYNNKKCSGSAFKHINKRYLHHLTLLCSSNLDLLNNNLKGDDSIVTSATVSTKSLVSNLSIEINDILKLFPIKEVPIIPFDDFGDYQRIFRKVPFTKQGSYDDQPYKIDFFQNKIEMTYQNKKIKELVENFDFNSSPDLAIQDFLKQVLYYDFEKEQLRLKDHGLESFYQ